MNRSLKWLIPLIFSLALTASLLRNTMFLHSLLPGKFLSVISAGCCKTARR